MPPRFLAQEEKGALTSCVDKVLQATQHAAAEGEAVAEEAEVAGLIQEHAERRRQAAAKVRPLTSRQHRNGGQLCCSERLNLQAQWPKFESEKATRRASSLYSRSTDTRTLTNGKRAPLAAFAIFLALYLTMRTSGSSRFPR